MTTLLDATLIRYIPRNTLYTVLQHNLLIKSENGSWANGCAYQEKDNPSSQIYVRPYGMFDESKWQIVE